MDHVNIEMTTFLGGFRNLKHVTVRPCKLAWSFTGTWLLYYTLLLVLSLLLDSFTSIYRILKNPILFKVHFIPHTVY